MNLKKLIIVFPLALLVVILLTVVGGVSSVLAEAEFPWDLEETRGIIPRGLTEEEYNMRIEAYSEHFPDVEKFYFITSRDRERIVTRDYTETYLTRNHGFDYLEEYIGDFGRDRLRRIAGSTFRDFPERELISINNEPWQQSEYADVVESRFNALTPYVYDARFEDVIYNSEFNGLLDIVVEEIEKFGEVNVIDYSYEEIEEFKEETKSYIEETEAKINEGKLGIDLVSTEVYDYREKGDKKDDENDKGGDNGEEDKAIPGPPDDEIFKLKLDIGLAETMVYIGENLLEKPLDAAPYIENSRTMMPLRGVVDEFGANLGWNGDTREVTVTDGDNNIILTIGSKTARVNGESVAMDTAPEIENDRTFIPLRFVSENIDLNVEWFGSTQVIRITP